MKNPLKTFKFSIVLFIFSFFIFNFSVANAATIYIDPSEADYGPGDTFIAKIRIDNGDECVNVVGVEISFPNELLNASEFSKGGSILTLWIGEPFIDNEKGYIKFAGGIPAGYCGRVKGDPALSNILGKIIFNVPASVLENEETKIANVSVLDSSQVLLNDGLGTVASLNTKGAKFSINPLMITQRNEWLDELRGDTVPPEPFKVTLQRSDDVFMGRYYIIFSTIDKLSGVDYYEVLESDKAREGFVRGSNKKAVWKKVSSPYILEDQFLLSDIVVRAVDKVGNKQDGEYIHDETVVNDTSKIAVWFFSSLVVIGILFAVMLRVTKSKKLLEESPMLKPQHTEETKNEETTINNT